MPALNKKNSLLYANCQYGTTLSIRHARHLPIRQHDKILSLSSKKIYPLFHILDTIDLLIRNALVRN